MELRLSASIAYVEKAMRRLSQHSHLATTLILLIALGLRLTAVAVFHSEPVLNDAAQYSSIATSLAEGGGFSLHQRPTAWRDPLYPITLAFAYKLFGTDVLVARFLQCAILVASCLVVIVLGSTLFGRITGLIAGLVLALCPFHILMAVPLYTEPLVGLLLAAGTLLLVHLLGHYHWVRAGAAGVMAGLVSLARATMLFLPLVWGAVILAWAKSRAWAWKSAVLILLGSLVVLTPWGIRNQAQFGNFMMTAPNLGLHLWLATVNQTGGGWTGWEDERLVATLGTHVNAATYMAEHDQLLLRQALRNIQDDLPAYLMSVLQRMLFNWRIPYVAVWFGPFSLLGKIFFGLWHSGTLALALLGILSSLKRRYQPALWATLPSCLYLTLVHSILIANPRFMAVLLPLVTVLTAWGIVRLFTRVLNILHAGRWPLSRAEEAIS